jgi:hypothetical protein
MGMTGAAALAYFTLEVGRASAAFGISAPPTVRAITVAERHPLASALAIAYVDPSTPAGFTPEIVVMWHLLWSGDRRLIRCVARHEVAHVALGQQEGARDEAELARFEAAVNAELRARWHEPANCGVK